MNTELFIAKHIFGKSRENVSRPVVRIAVVSIALGLMVMIISVAVVTGFQQEIREKVIGFGAHLQIVNFDQNVSMEANPVNMNQPFYPGFDTLDGVEHIQVFASKAGIIKTENQIQGVVLKGIGRDYDWSFFEDRVVEGQRLYLPDTASTDNVLISRSLANLLELNTGDPLRMYFIAGDQSRARGRRFNISGIYETGLEEFDRMIIIGDIRHIQKLNRWNDNQVGGFEILLDDFEKMDEVQEMIFNNISYDLDVRSIRDLYPQIFDWLELQDKNVVIIIVLMVLVSGITMISTLLILILERTNMIGILKALGARNLSVRKIFLYNAAYIIGIGLIWGNLLGIGLSLIQDVFEIITLDQESYYVRTVPVHLDLFSILLINAGTILICMLMLIVPSWIVTRITPVKAIRFS